MNDKKDDQQTQADQQVRNSENINPQSPDPGGDKADLSKMPKDNHISEKDVDPHS